MKLVGRVYAIRKHKNKCFFDIITNKQERKQCSIDVTNNKKNIIKMNCIVMSNNFKENITMSGSSVVSLITFEIIYSNNTTVTIKKDSNYPKKVSLKNKEKALLGYENLKFLKIRSDIYFFIMKQLRNDGFVQLFTNTVENHRGAYSVNPFQVISTDKKNHYLRITTENNLKKHFPFLLTPIFELGKVYRNMGYNSKTSSEYTVLECIVPFFTVEKLYNLLLDIVSKIEIFLHSYNLEDIIDIKVFGKPKVIVYNSIKEEVYQEKKKKFNNHIIINANNNSPFINKNINNHFDFEWIFDGVELAHGYIDENDTEILLKRFHKQIYELKEHEIEAEIDWELIEALNYGTVPSGSLILGVDRFIGKIFKLDNLIHITQPIGF